MTDTAHIAGARRLGLLRFAIISDLLMSPPPRGQLRAALQALAERTWTLPCGTPTTFGFSTIEGWYYDAREASDPVAALTSKARSDRGTRRVIDDTLLAELERQYVLHPSWTAKLHAKNLAATVREKYAQTHSPPPSYATVRRAMNAQGWRRQRRPRTEGHAESIRQKSARETRSFEMTHAHALWHFDFHDGSRRVLGKDGTWHTPQLLAFLDDRTRIICHIQWYLAEDVERLVHGLTQAILKRGLPRAVHHDNGSAMKAAEFRQGLEDLGVTSKPTLGYSPEQNGKVETLWAAVESQLMAMLERVDPLDLDTLNRATQAWAEGEYHREVHDSLRVSPLERFEASDDASRPSPSLEELRRAFTQQEPRTQRRSDGTISILGTRFEIPSRLRTLRKVSVRFRRWDLSEAWIVDPRTRDVLARIVPLDLEANADGRRASLEEPDTSPAGPDVDDDPMPARLRELLRDYAADGLPPGFLPLDDTKETP